MTSLENSFEPAIGGVSISGYTRRENGCWQLEEDRQFPLYRQWTKVTKKNKVRFQRDSLPRHPVDWTNRETRRSKWYKKKFGSQ